MEVGGGRAVKIAIPKGRSGRGGGLEPPDLTARSGEVAKEDRQLAHHRTRSRQARELFLFLFCDLFLYQHKAVSAAVWFLFVVVDVWLVGCFL